MSAQASNPGPRRLRLWGLRAGVAVVSAGLAFLPCELLARVYAAPPEYVDGMRFDPRMGNMTSPGLRVATADAAGPFEYRTNSLGFRGAEFPRGRSAGAGRVLFVGDSFVNAWGVREEDTMSGRVAVGLSQDGRRHEGFNVCSDDIGTGQELLLWREHGRALEPDLVVLVMFPGNDVANNGIALAGRSEWSPGDYVRPYLVADQDDGSWQTRYAFPARSFLRRHLRSFAWLEHRVVTWAKRRSVDWLSPFGPGKSPADRVADGHVPFEELEPFCLHESEPSWDLAWATTEGLLETFRDEVEASGSRFLLAVVPVRYQVQRDAMSEARELSSWLLAGKALSELVDFSRRSDSSASVMTPRSTPSSRSKPCATRSDVPRGSSTSTTAI